MPATSPLGSADCIPVYQPASNPPWRKLCGSDGFSTAFSYTTVPNYGPTVDQESGVPQAVSGTTSLTGVMMGLASGSGTQPLLLSPALTGNYRIESVGEMQNSVSLNGVTCQPRYGIGTPPVNGAALTGNAFGAAKTSKLSAVNGRTSFHVKTLLPGLTVGGGPYWVDLACNVEVGGTGTLQGMTFLGNEVATQAPIFQNFLSSSLGSFALTRAGTVATYFDSTGTLQTAGANVARFDYDPSALTLLGLLVEPASTNSLRNNTMQGASAPSTLPTNWTQTNSTGLTATVVGTGTDSGITYIDLQLSGTTTTGTVNNFFFETAAAIATASGQTWTGSLYYKLVGGSTTNISSIALGVQGTNGTTQTEIFSSNITTPTSSWLRATKTATLANAGTTDVRSLFTVTSNAAPVAINLTLRIGMPQLEQNGFATSAIATTNAAVSRSADALTIAAPNASAPIQTQEGGTVLPTGTPYSCAPGIAAGAYTFAWCSPAVIAGERHLQQAAVQ